MIKDLQAVKKLIREEDAEMLSYSIIDFTGSEEILRGWPASKIPKDMLEPCAEYLSTIGSEKNNKETFYVDDPLIDKEKWPGRYQRFFGGWQMFGRELYLTQVLRKGFYQSVSLTSEASGERIVTEAQQYGLTMETPATVEQTAGVIKSQRLDIDRRDGSRTLFTSTDAGQEQTNTTTQVSAAGTIVVEEKTVQASALAAPTYTQGIIKKIANLASKYYQRWTTISETRTPTDQTATSTYSDGMEGHSAVSHTENPSTPTAAASVQGTIKEVEAQPTEAGNLQTREITKTSKAVSVASYVARYGENGIEYRTEEYHKLTPPAISDETANGIETTVLAHDLDAFLTHNYKVSRVDRASKFPFSGVISYAIYGDYEMATSQVYSEALGRYWNDKTYVYQQVTTYSMQYFKTAALAYAYIAGARLTNNSGSRVEHTGEFQWLAIKIVRTKTLITTYEYTEPTS